MTVRITYFVHAATKDNERGIATGWNPGALSAQGQQQAIDLQKAVKRKRFAAVFSSDLDRAVDSAKLMFPSKPIVQDKRLRECDYGELTGARSEQVEREMKERTVIPFQGGESLKDVERRMRSFLDDVLKNYDGKRVAIVSHRAPQLALEVIVNRKDWRKAIEDDWRNKNPKEWQPGWEYELVSP